MPALLRRCAETGLLVFLFVAAGEMQASAQAPNAADICTPDVMRLCSEFIPDRDRIVACLKRKRRQMSPQCVSALSQRGKKPMRQSRE
jgi:hypothetical protein